MLSENVETLRDAIVRNSPAVVSFPSAGILRHHKSRFIAAQDSGFWVEVPHEETALIEQLVKEGKVVGLAMKNGESKVVFVAKPIEFHPQMAINKQTKVDALLLEWPEELKKVQRRTDYRVVIPHHEEVAIKAWRIADRIPVRDRPAPSAQLKLTVRNLSAGGMMILVEPRENDPTMVVDQRLRVALMHEEKEHILDARVKHFESLPAGGLRIGVQFRKLTGDLEGRQALAALSHVIGHFQREEAKRRKFTRVA